MITKYAQLESILEIRSSNTRLSYDYDESDNSRFSKFAALNPGIREEDGYLYVRCRAISSRVNKNNDGWPSEELARGYKTFESRPIFVDHNNSDPKRTRGVIVASDLHVDDEKTSALDPYYSSAPENHKPPTWIELLLEVDSNTYPRLARAIKTGDIDAVSMGANIDRSICSVCAHEATTPSEYCKHIKQKGMTFEITADNGEKVQKKAYEDCMGVNFFEISFVFDPADPTADLLTKSASKKYSEIDVRQMAEKSGSDFNEIAAYLESRGEYDGPRGTTAMEYLKEASLSDMVGKTLPLEKVAAFRKNALGAEQFIAPKDQPSGQTDRNYIPQSEMVTAPQHVDTLRNDHLCPICKAADMQQGADGIHTCPLCGHVQEPAPLNNPDLGVARQNDLRLDNAQPGQSVTPVNSDPLDTVQFDVGRGQATSKKNNNARGISEMSLFKTKLRTRSKKEADKLLPAKVAKIEVKLGRGIHRGIYEAASKAGLEVKVSYPAVKSTEDNSVRVPGNNGIFNLFYAEESAINLGVPLSEVPIVVEASSVEDAEKFVKLVKDTPLPSRRPTAGNDKQPLLPGSKPKDNPKKEIIVNDPKSPVESAVIDAEVDVDGEKHHLLVVPKEKDFSGDEEALEDDSEGIKSELEELGESDDHRASVVDDREDRLLASFELADMATEMGLVGQENKMAFIAELEEESLAQLTARKETLVAVKNAGLSRRAANSPLQGIRRVPRLSHAVPTMNGSGTGDDTPIEALYL